MRRILLWIAAAVLAGTAVWWLVPKPVPDARPVTAEEAGRLALSRYNNYQSSPVRVRVAAPLAGSTITVDAVIDYRAQHAVGSYQRPGSTPGLVAWDERGLGIAEGRTGDPLAEAADMPATSWSPRSFSTEPLDTALRLSMLLGQDRPDNAQVLAEQGPQWLRGETLDGRAYDVFSGPRPRSATTTEGLTYWLGGDGSLRRVTARIARIDSPVVIDFPGGPAGEVPATPWRAN